MIKSMTGFGRGEFTDDKRSVVAEIRTVNHRYADITIKMPKRYSFAEEKIKAIVKETVKRGKADVSIVIENISESDVDVKLNGPLAEKYLESLRSLQNRHLLSGEIDIKLLASMPDVIRIIPDVEDEDAVAEAMCSAVAVAARNIDEMRVIEGEKLVEDLRMRGELVRGIIADIEKRALDVAREYAEKIRERIGELIGEIVDIPEERILTEAAIFADKSNITEELVRLDSHMKQMIQIFDDAAEPVGKKLDFLAQEMNREANTIGSKANDIHITSSVLEAKSEIEKIREQIQNIE